jgi:hypothetical protein
MRLDNGCRFIVGASRSVTASFVVTGPIFLVSWLLGVRLQYPLAVVLALLLSAGLLLHLEMRRVGIVAATKRLVGLLVLGLVLSLFACGLVWGYLQRDWRAISASIIIFVGMSWGIRRVFGKHLDWSVL